MKKRRMPDMPYQIVFKPAPDAPDVVLRRAATPDQATVAYHEERERLWRQHAAGELAMLWVIGEQRTLLHEPITA
jgi:hypothetical protein